MGDARWETLWAVFHEAADLVGDARVAYLDDACGGHAGLRDDIEALLATHRASGPLDDAPALAQLAADVLDPAVLIGTRVGRYTIESVIGAGGMGAVYAAEQREPVRRVVALKIVKPSMSHRMLADAVGPAHSQTISQARRLTALYDAWGKADKATEYRVLLPPD